jgi:hypothetical protein
MLKAIGFWIVDLHDSNWPAPQELVGVMPADQRARLVAYLAAGMTHESYLGLSWCRFGCGIDWALMGSRDLTDGVWLWPEGLAHYVRDHNIVLPEEFMVHALSRATPRLPGWPDNDLQLVSETRAPEPVEYEFWQQWSSTRRSPQLLDRLRTGQRAAEALAAADRSKELQSLVNERGLSDANCIWKGCGHKALAGLYVCADHHLRNAPDLYLGHRMRPELLSILGDLSRAFGIKPNFSLERKPNARTAAGNFLRKLLQGKFWHRRRRGPPSFRRL